MQLTDTFLLMMMIGLGSFPAGDVSTFQMFQDQSVQGHGGHSPWTQQYCQNYQLPADVSSRLQSDQFTPQDYASIAKLPPRQLQWVSSHTRGYNRAPSALSYDPPTFQTSSHPLSQPHQVKTTSNPVWFNQPVSRNPSATTADSSLSNHVLRTFQHPTKNYFADFPVEQADDVMLQSQYDYTTPAVSEFSTDRPPASDCTSSINYAKPDAACSSDWSSTVPVVWQQQQSACSSTTSHQSTLLYSTLSTDVTQWQTTCEQPTKVTPSTSIGEQTNSTFIFNSA